MSINVAENRLEVTLIDRKKLAKESRVSTTSQLLPNIPSKESLNNYEYAPRR